MTQSNSGSYAGPPGDLGAPNTPANAPMGRKWSDFLAQPGALAMLAQTAINLTQPAGPGQTTIGHIGRAIGGGLEAAGRNISARKKMESDAQDRANEERRLAQTDRQLNISQQAAERAGQPSASSLLSSQDRWNSKFLAYVNDLAKQADTSMGTDPNDPGMEEFWRKVRSNEDGFLDKLREQFSTIYPPPAGEGAPPEAGAPASAIPDAASLPLVTSDADFAKLAPGAYFKDKDGNVRQKPAGGASG